jgi:shikimate O-hydroxycinnamoyltransferase
VPEYALNPIEHVFTGPGSQPITFAFSYSATLDPDALRRGLDDTLVSFPMVKSQLRRTAADEYVFHLTDAGLAFDVAQTDLEFQRSQSAEQYVTPARSVEGQPLTRIALAQTPKGSVLAVSMSHALADGFSFFHFLSSWARTCRGARILEPSMDREVFRSIPNTGAGEVTADEILEACGLFYGGDRAGAPAGPGDVESFFISDGQIRSHMDSVGGARGSSLSANDAITALLWKKYLTTWIGAGSNPDTYVTCPVDFRRIMPGFPRNYFGCALCFATASIDLDGLATSSVGELAARVKAAVSRVRGPHITASMDTLDGLRRQQGLTALERVHLRHPRHGLIVTNLTRMPMRDIDFGFGAPLDFSTYVEVRGSSAILPAEGGVRIMVVRQERARPAAFGTLAGLT